MELKNYIEKLVDLQNKGFGEYEVKNGENYDLLDEDGYDIEFPYIDEDNKIIYV